MLAPAAPALACECGAGLVAPLDSEVSLVSQRAIVSLHNGVQQTDLLIKLTGTATSAGLIIPTPSPARVSVGSLKSFDDVERAMLPKARYVDDWWGVDAVTATVENRNPSIPVVLDRVRLGPLEAVSVTADDATGLSSWLRDNGFSASEGSAAILQPYIDSGWSFVAVKLTTSDVLTGTLDPIRLKFETDKIVFPTRMLQGSSAVQSLRLYVVDDHRVSLAIDGRENGQLNAAQKVVWAGPVSMLSSPVSSKSSTKPSPRPETFMTVFEIRYDNPTVQATTDIGVIQAPNDEQVARTVTVVKTMSLLGIPFGSVLVGTGLIALAMLMATLMIRLRAR